VLVHCEGAVWVERAAEAGVQCEPLLRPSKLYQLRREEIRNGLWQHVQHAAWAYQEARQLAGKLQALELDLVHTNTLKAHVVGGLAARRNGWPLIWHLRDILAPGPARRVLWEAARRMRPHVVCISEAVAATLPEGEPSRQVIYNGTPLERFGLRQPGAGLRAELGLEGAEAVLAIVSRLTPWKGHQALLRALTEVLRRHPQTVLLVVGEPAFWNEEYSDELQRLAAELGVSEATRFTGYREDVPEVLALTDVFVLPSTDEPFGRVIVEAMAMERPVVATETGGVPEIVVPGETGMLVPPEDPAALAEAIVALLGDPQRGREMGRRGRERVLEHFDARRTVAQVQQVYEEVLVTA
jgi:glycosyltransferase involved in cell wall biosynthesis